MSLRSRPLLREVMSRRYDTASLAKKTGLSKQVIGYLVSEGPSARTSCSRNTAELIAAALEVKVDLLFCDRVSSDSDVKEKGVTKSLTIPEAGRVIGVSRATAYRLVGDGSLAVYDAARDGATRTKLRVRPEAITDFQAKRAIA